MKLEGNLFDFGMLQRRAQVNDVEVDGEVPCPLSRPSSDMPNQTNPFRELLIIIERWRNNTILVLRDVDSDMSMLRHRARCEHTRM